MSRVTWGAGGDSYSDVDLSGKELFVRFAGFRRDPDDPTRLLVKSGLAFGYVERDGQVYKRGTQSKPETLVVDPGDCYQDKFYWRFEVVTGEFAGEEVPHSTRLKGIVFPSQERIKFITVPPLSGFIQTVAACGLSLAALDDTSQLYSPEYFHPSWIASLEIPLSFEQVLLRLVEPKLLQLAEEGHVIRVQTQPESNWIKWDSFAALSPEEAQKIRAAEQGGPVGDVGELRGRILRDVQNGVYTASEVAAIAKELCPTLKPGESILAQLDGGQLQKLLQKLQDQLAAPSL